MSNCNKHGGYCMGKLYGDLTQTDCLICKTNRVIADERGAEK